MKLVLASHNAGKLAELQAMFEPLGLQLLRQSELGIGEAEEPFRTFVENALAKARHAARASGLPAIADDAGLCVHAFGGLPGVDTAYYATQFGYAKGDDNNVKALLEQMRGGSSHRNYRDAFVAATEAMRVHAFSGGAARLSTGAAGGYAGLRAGAEGGGAAGSTELDDMQILNEQSEIDMHASVASFRDHGGAAQQARAELCPWQVEDVIQFLSKDGDSEVIYLWRERALRRSEAVPGAVGEQTPSVAPGKLPVIEGFFCKKIPDKKQLVRDIEA
jgi:non-canonical purine NTP pyrophosphatase (RdgB/HAM1 family)